MLYLLYANCCHRHGYSSFRPLYKLAEALPLNILASSTVSWQLQQLFCIPYVTDICKDLAPFQFIWNKNVCPSAACNILILGDSYSEQHLWTDHLQRITGYNIVNLAVGSATLA